MTELAVSTQSQVNNDEGEKTYILKRPQVDHLSNAKASACSASLDEYSRAFINTFTENDLSKKQAFINAAAMILINRYSQLTQITIENVLPAEGPEAAFFELSQLYNGQNSFFLLYSNVLSQLSEKEKNLFHLKMSAKPKSDLLIVNSCMLDFEQIIEERKFSFVFVFSNENETYQVFYDNQLYSESVVSRMMDNFSVVLKNVCDDVYIGLDDVSVLSDEDMNYQIYGLNDTHSDYIIEKPIFQLIEDQVKSCPDNVAIIHKGKSLTYREFNGKSNFLAKRLQQLGVKKGDFVPLVMNRSLELPVSQHAIMKLGAAFVPVDINWPAGRINQILTNVAAPLVLFNKNIMDFDIQSISNYNPVEVDIHALEMNESDDMGVMVSFDDPIFVIFTSGSTGEPKGAINLHKGIANRFLYMNKRYGCGAGDKILLTSNHVFDSSVWQLFWPLINGSQCIIPEHTQMLDILNLIRLVEEHNITVTDFVPSVFNLLVDLIEEDPEMALKLKSLRQLLIGGEEMRSQYIYKFKKYLPEVSITNTYGPSETSIGTIFYEIKEEFENPIPIGRPIDNVKVMILDKNRKMVPYGGVGELFIGGICVGKGYLNDPVRTDEVFAHHVINGIDLGMFYKTGDRACYIKDGDIQFLGRVDNQVKVNGIRIELSEIEMQLVDFPGIKQAIVINRTDESGHSYLCAYFVATKFIEITELKDYLGQFLPRYMIPAYFTQLSQFTLNNNGKVDRKQLPLPEPAAVEEPGKQERTEIEDKVMNLWKVILKQQDDINIDNNFFDIGGQSIKAIRMKAEIKSMFEVDISMLDMFNKATIRELSEIIETKLGKGR